MDCSMPGFPVLHHLPELAQTYVHWVSDAIQPSHALSPPSPPALSLCQHGVVIWQAYVTRNGCLWQIVSNDLRWGYCHMNRLEADSPLSQASEMTTTLVVIWLLSFLMWLHHMAFRILGSRPEIEPKPTAVKVQSLNYWTAMESPLGWFWNGDSELETPG